MQITETNQFFLNLYKSFEDSKECKGLEFAKVVLANSEIIKDHLEYIEKMAIPSEEFIQLSIKAKKLLDVEKIEDLQKLEAEEDNAKVIASRKEQLAKVNEELQKEVTLELKTLKESDIPKDISVANYGVLKPLIK